MQPLCFSMGSVWTVYYRIDRNIIEYLRVCFFILELHLMNNMVMLGALVGIWTWNRKASFYYNLFLSGIGEIYFLWLQQFCRRICGSAGAGDGLDWWALLYGNCEQRKIRTAFKSKHFYGCSESYFGLTSSGVDNMAHIGAHMRIPLLLFYTDRKIHYNEYWYSIRPAML